MHNTMFSRKLCLLVRSFVLILTRNNGSELKTSVWGIISGGYAGLVCGYTLCDRLPALPDWLSCDCNAVVHDLGLHTVMKKEVMGVRVLLWSVGAAGVL
jgi:hypothetical protein